MSVLCILMVLIASLGMASVTAAETSGGLTSRVDMQKKYADEFYSEGMYKIGMDMPAGEYMVFASSGAGYFCRSQDSNQDNIIENANFEYNSIICVNDGEYLKLSRSFAVPLETLSNEDLDLSGTGMFKAGLHFPAGEYKLAVETGETGYYAIYNERNSCRIVTNDLFEGNSYVTVYEGQYIELSRCHFDPAPAKLEKVYTDTEIIKTVQGVLNELGYDCGEPDGSAGPRTKAAILQYQKDNSLPENGMVSESLVNALLGITEEAGTENDAKEESKEPGITWKQLARTPDEYLGKEVTFLGEVIQVMEGDGFTQFRLAVDGNHDTILLCEVQNSAISVRLLDGDIAEVQGLSVGLVSYETIMGGTVTIPGVLASIVTIYE